MTRRCHRLLLLGFLAILGFSNDASAATRGPAEATYVGAFAWTPATWTLAGTETVTFRNTLGTPRDTVWFRLWANGPRGCDDPAISVSVTAGGTAGALTTDCTALPVSLPAPLAPGATATIALSLTIVVPDINDRFGRSTDAAMLGHALPILAVEDARGIHSTEPYSSNGESFYALAATWNVTLDLPAGFDAVTTGHEVSARTTVGGGGARLQIGATAARDFALAIGRFATSTRTVGSTIVRVTGTSAFTADDRAGALYTATRSMTAYTRWYGAYRAPELDIVLWDGPGGMEWPELLMSRSGSIAHEVAHQWWYGIVGNDQYTEPWLDEAFATYSQKRLDDGEAYGAATCVKGNPLEAYGNASLRDSMARFDRYTSQYDAIYSGGACALWQLAAATGAGWFDGFAQALVTTYAGDVLTTDDLIATLRARAPVGFDVDRYLAEARLVDPPRRDLITFRPDVLAPTRRAARGSTLFATTMTGAAPATVTIETGSARFRTSAFTGPAGRLVGRLLVDARLADQMPVDAAVRTGPCAPGRGTWHVVITAPSAGCMPISAVRTAARVTLTLDLTAIMALEAHGVTLRLDDTAMTRPGRRARAITTRIAVAPCVPGTGPTACTAAGPAASRFVLETIGGTTGVTLQRTRLRAGRATVVGRVLRAGKPVAATVDICVRARGATGGCGVYAATIEVGRKSFRFVFRRSSAVVVTVQAHSPLAPEALRRQATLLGSLRA